MIDDVIVVHGLRGKTALFFQKEYRVLSVTPLDAINNSVPPEQLIVCHYLYFLDIGSS